MFADRSWAPRVACGVVVALYLLGYTAGAPLSPAHTNGAHPPVSVGFLAATTGFPIFIGAGNSSAAGIPDCSVRLTTHKTNKTVAATATPTLNGTSSLASSTSTQSVLPTSSLDTYQTYLGDGSAAQGWPTMADWVDFEYMWMHNLPNIQVSCEQWGVPDNSAQESIDLHDNIVDVAKRENLDPRFVLAITLQESTGCVRVITTSYSHPNPGLMQSFNGTGSCNDNAAPLGLPGVTATGEVQTPCPDTEIEQMITDGTSGTQWGPGLSQDFQQQGMNNAQGYYRTARIYNGGSLESDGSLEGPCCTASYSSDIANRLTGWVNAPHNFIE